MDHLKKLIFCLNVILSLSLVTAFAIVPHHAIHKPAKKHHNTVVKMASENVEDNQKVTSVNVKEDTNKISGVRVKHLNHHFDKIIQNHDNPKPTTKWLKSLGIGGLVNVDFNYQTKPHFTEARSEDFVLSAAKINIIAKANDWVTGQIGFFAADDKHYYYAKERRHVALDEAYIAFKNLAKQPFYLVIGRQYLPFGRYHRYPIVKAFTEELSATRDTALQLGFVDGSGLYGALYTFHGLKKSTKTHQHTLNNCGAALGYDYVKGPVEIDLGVGYLNNMVDVGDLMAAMDSHYHRRVGALDLHADVLSGPFSFGARFVTALAHFSPMDIAYRKHENIYGAKPEALFVNLGYAFKTMDRDSKLSLGYQWSNEAYEAQDVYDLYHTNGMPLQLPKNRYSLSYGVDVLKHTIVVLEYDRDRDYESQYGGTNHYNNMITLRLTVLV